MDKSRQLQSPARPFAYALDCEFMHILGQSSALQPVANAE